MCNFMTNVTNRRSIESLNNNSHFEKRFERKYLRGKSREEN